MHSRCILVHYFYQFSRDVALPATQQCVSDASSLFAVAQEAWRNLSLYEYGIPLVPEGPSVLRERWLRVHPFPDDR